VSGPIVLLSIRTRRDVSQTIEDLLPCVPWKKYEFAPSQEGTCQTKAESDAFDGHSIPPSLRRGVLELCRCRWTASQAAAAHSHAMIPSEPRR
jgi:hypothetical protein